MVIPAGQQRDAGRRADPNRVKPSELEPLAGEFVELRGRNRTAEGRWLTESDVVEEDHDNIGSTFGRLQRLAESPVSSP